MEQKSPYELQHEIARLEGLVKKYEALEGCSKLARRYRIKLAAAQAALNPIGWTPEERLERAEARNEFLNKPEGGAQ